MGMELRLPQQRIGPLVWSGQQRFLNANVDLYRQAVNLEPKAIFFVFLRNTNILIIICSNNVDIW